MTTPVTTERPSVQVLRTLIAKWRARADFEKKNGNIKAATVFAVCANELEQELEP